MSVRAKLRLVSKKIHAGGSQTLQFNCVYSPEVPEDQSFMKATPWGTCELSIDNPVALEQFELGKSYYVDFSPVEQ